MKRHLNYLYAHRLNMLPLYGLPGLPETKPELKGYSVGLLAMYITHTVGTAASWPCYNPLTGKPLNHLGLICICALSTVYYNLAMFPLLDYATPVTVQTQGNNTKFILSHCSKDVFKHSFLLAVLRCWNALPQSAVEATSLELFKAILPSFTY